MTRVETLLSQHRTKQIAQFEGREAPTVEMTVPRAPKPRASEALDLRLIFSKHARKRMAQRGMRENDVYALYQSGEFERQTGGTSRYRATDRSIRESDNWHRQSLSKFRGSYIVVSEDCRTVITVVHFGMDSR